MKVASACIPSGLRWQYWITVLRILVLLTCITAEFIVPAIMYGLPLTIYRSLLLVMIPLLMWLIYDILLLTLDVKRTGWFLGTVLAQAMLILPSFGTVFVFMGFYGYIWPWGVVVATCCILHMFCTLCLGVHLLVSKWRAGNRACWKSNAKDMFLGTSSNQDRMSLFGRPRDLSLSTSNVSGVPYFCAVVVPRVMLRRISPVESKRYALFQNTCALLFIVTIAIRAVMALSQAQNQMETRTTAGPCSDMSNQPDLDNIRVLVRHKYLAKGYNVTVQVTVRDIKQHQCTSELVKTPPYADEWLQVFSCGSYDHSRDNYFYAAYNITVRSTNGVPLDTTQLPDVWLANIADSARVFKQDGLDSPKDLAPWLVPAWQLVAGQRIHASVEVADRRFIVSSFFRDIIANLKPTYKSTSLFTITTKEMTPSADNLATTALLTPSRMSSLSYLSHYDNLHLDAVMLPVSPSCAFIEDYRSSTIFDALGSIGGLFAILQGVHILLFGRPLFWGIAGAKLISPFGIFGRCHSNRFRRQFREKYYRQSRVGSTSEMAETIRVGAFLRDFVIDFGPTDMDEEEVESGQNNGHKKTLSEVSGDGQHGPNVNL